jgi:hypothetical protein
MGEGFPWKALEIARGLRFNGAFESDDEEIEADVCPMEYTRLPEGEDDDCDSDSVSDDKWTLPNITNLHFTSRFEASSIPWGFVAV